MQAFHNDPTLKEMYVQRMYAHKAADTLIQGEGWNGISGCNIGCALEEYDHSKYPELIGLPVWLARLQDTIFEGLSLEDGINFASEVFPAIQVGADVENVQYKLAILRHKKQLVILADNNEPYAIQCKAAIQGVIDYLELKLIGAETAAETAAESAAWAAESAAWSAETARSAAWAAESAAESAAWAAESAAWSAETAAETARSAAWAAESAAESAAWSAESAAESAAWSAARSDYFKWEAETLIRLLKESK